jgi:hypothetical protein
MFLAPPRSGRTGVSASPLNIAAIAKKATGNLPNKEESIMIR